MKTTELNGTRSPDARPDRWDHRVIFLGSQCLSLSLFPEVEMGTSELLRKKDLMNLLVMTVELDIAKA